MAFGLSFWNPFSQRFLQPEPEHSMVRQADAALNSYGRSEDAIDWRRLTHGYYNGSVEGQDVYDSSGILFETVFASKRQRINFYRRISTVSICKEMSNYYGRRSLL